MALTEKSVEEFLEEMASRKPAPGGGSAAALAGSLAAALVEMVGRLTDTERMREITAEAEKARHRLAKLVDEDCQAFKEFIKAPKNEREAALKQAALVPLETAGLSYRILELVEEIAGKGNKSAITDVGVAAMLANTAVQGANLNVRINLGSIPDEEFRKTVEEKLERFADSPERSQAVTKYVRQQLSS